MRICFVIQGEGRGHFTQALAMREFLLRHGHQVVAAIAGTNGRRPLPDYALNAFGVPLQSIFSPGFHFKAQRGISITASLTDALSHLPQLSQSLNVLEQTIAQTQPDLIINFLEAATGVGKLLGRIRIPVLVLGHQFMLFHPAFIHSNHERTQQWGFRNFVRLVGSKSSKLALSFYRAPDLPNSNLHVCPPLLRKQLFEIKQVVHGHYLLVYLLNHGYATDIERWCQDHPEVPVHCFYDKPGAPDEEKRLPSLVFHKLHGDKFLQMMAECRAVVCTAGFESVSEAAYLGKPVLMIPVQNHIEQYLNALDAVHAGFGIRDSMFNLNRLLEPATPRGGPAFKAWVDEAESIVIKAVERAAQSGI